MYLSRLILNPRSPAVRRDLGDIQSMHRTLMRAFGQAASHANARQQVGLLYRLESPPLSPRLQLLIQSRLKPDWGFLPGDYLAPVAENLAVKEVDALWVAIQPGQVLRFRLRANPTRKVDTKSAPDGTRRNGRRVPLRGDDALIEWLQRKAEQAGFRLLYVRRVPAVVDVRTSHMEREVARHVGRETARVTGHHENGPLTIDSVVFEGHLAVTDRDRFLEALERGIGPAKAYGCGLLSLAPA